MDVDLNELFALSLPLGEILLRGTVFYWFLFLLFRFVVRRDVGAVGIADVLMIVIVADASQNAIAGEYKSITDGMILVSTLLFWNVLLDWLSFRYECVRRFVQPAALELVRNGRVNYRNLRREFITEDELWSRLRQEGVESLRQVKRAYMETDGQISVVKHSG